MSLIKHAERELKLAGMFDEDADYNGKLAPTIMEVVKVFASFGHSGGSAGISIAVLEKLLRFQNLTPLTNNPDEWNDVSEMNGSPMWQSNRNPSCFSTDNGKTYYSVDDKEQKTITSEQRFP